jgi:hypothetical protein
MIAYSPVYSICGLISAASWVIVRWPDGSFSYGLNGASGLQTQGYFETEEQAITAVLRHEAELAHVNGLRKLN